MVVTQSRKINVRSVALPAEHGGWGFLLEPILLGLLVAASWNGVLLCIGMISLFLVHQPLKIAGKDWLKRRRTPRTALAERFTLGYGSLGGVLLLVVTASAGTAFWIPLLMAVPLVIVQGFYDFRNDSRDLIPEIAGAVALGAIAPTVVLLKGWELDHALLLWVILLVRSIPSILYVRARLRLERGKPFSQWPSALSHILGVLLLVGLAVPFSPILAALILLVRAVWGLSQYRRPAPRPAIIGVQELLYGVLFVVLTALAYG